MHRLALTFALILASSTAARAKGEPRPEIRAIVDDDGHVARLIRSFGDDARAALQVPGSSKAFELHDGESVGTIVAGHGRIVVALAPTAENAPLQIYVADGNKPPPATAVERPGGRRDLPFAVAATATPDGFAVFFQDIEEADPTAAHTYLVTLDKAGAVVGIAEVPVPWSLAAAAWNGAGYHLALIYMSGEGMRLSMVSLTAAGQPEQHPDWASRPDFISDVHLDARNGTIRAFYRGAGGTRLHERDVTTIGQWGGNPPKAKDHGALPRAKVIAVDKKGKPLKMSERVAK